MKRVIGFIIAFLSFAIFLGAVERAPLETEIQLQRFVC